MDTNFAAFLSSLGTPDQKQGEEAAVLRPIVFIGLGGFGCATIRAVKAEIEKLVPQHAEGFAFLGLDTHAQPINDVLTANEYVPLSVGVDPEEVARQHPNQLGWYRQLMGTFRARTIQSGADETKSVGRLAFRNPPTFRGFLDRLYLAHDQINRFRSRFARGVPPKVYVISTLAGGTGAGCLLDVLFVTGRFFRENVGVDFPYQAILATPDVLIGEVPTGHLPDLFANTYASLKELHHFFTSSDEPVESYDDARYDRLRLERQLLPNPVFLIGNTTEQGTSVAVEIKDVGSIVVAYLLSEVQTPMRNAEDGTPKVQDLENQSLNTYGQGGMPRAFSSFGVVRTGLPVEEVRNLFALRLIHSTLAQELQVPPDMFEQAETWVDAHKVKEHGVDQLQDLIRSRTGEALTVSTDARGKLLGGGTRYRDLDTRSREFLAERRTTLEADRKERIARAGAAVTAEVREALRASYGERLERTTLGQALAFVSELERILRQHQEALQAESAAAATLRTSREQEAELSLRGIAHAASMGWWRRGGPVEKAILNFDARVEKVLESEIDVWVKAAAAAVYAALLEDCSSLVRQWTPVREALAERSSSTAAFVVQTDLRLEHLADIGQRGKGNRFSLVNSQRALELYQSLVQPAQDAAAARLRAHWLRQGWFADVHSGTEQWLNEAGPHAVATEIAPRLRGLDVNSVIKRFHGEEGRKRRLFQDLQSLSSPLFWLDPTWAESQYDAYWIIGIHPDLRETFRSEYESELPGQGRIYAYFESPFEVVLYQVKFGYTLLSHRRLSVYEADYVRRQEQYLAARADRQPRKPIHGWAEAERWENLIPNPQAEEGLKWFVLGRAFSAVYPSSRDDGTPKPENTAYLYARGNHYYLQTENGGRQVEVRVGQGLEDAVAAFGDRPDWQLQLRKSIEAKVADVGGQSVRTDLEQGFLSILEEEYRKARKADAGEIGRAGLLNQMLGKLRLYLDEELRTSRI